MNNVRSHYRIYQNDGDALLERHANDVNLGMLHTCEPGAGDNTSDHERENLQNVQREENAKDDPRTIIDCPDTKHHCY